MACDRQTRPQIWQGAAGDGIPLRTWSTSARLTQANLRSPVQLLPPIPPFSFVFCYSRFTLYNRHGFHRSDSQTACTRCNHIIALATTSFHTHRPAVCLQQHVQEDGR